jgi:peptidyl-tRNA hydrolase, PTH1 family
MKIICGLGNPGREYERHRHNIGFLVLDALAQRWKAQFNSQKFEAELATANFAGHRVLLLKPQTFMNLSGQSLAGAARFYKVGLDEVLVVHDELDLPFGRQQLKLGGGSGGHNGLKSIAQSWGEQDYARLRFGVGRPPAPGPERVVGHVLSNFSTEEQPQLAPLIVRAVEACEQWARDGMQKAMNGFNRKA